MLGGAHPSSLGYPLPKCECIFLPENDLEGTRPRHGESWNYVKTYGLARCMITEKRRHTPTGPGGGRVKSHGGNNMQKKKSR